ncbi:NAD(P)-dependent oxidoreductase [Candidatus Poribacteria bacterium]|jgi:NAD+ dependent glucose-6-phosphate dehydrogenase|nr:NAD(P)-dependent oxidoreductase [Candidatus Poribacteria bacterium]MBT5712962.1 NAD(P)-dependent oxidoreductase [Candidatus Poribacteria bacterium]MBT7100224.1 NAD(P)-dependent oxidoreductase [Candidatus Poribacteria bacterium]MBT7808443.1 NAD(P)-dependent oxidoreductase [Candidatus Poribacteria bacterium]
MTDRRRVLITGAAGLVSSILREHWGDRYALRLTDIVDVPAPGDHETRNMDITDLDAFRSACEGIDTVIHLAADRSPSADFYETLLDLNIIGTYNAFQAAADAGCRRVIFASSVNAIIGYTEAGRGRVLEDDVMYPANVYGATKCWGEALGRVFSHKHGVSSIAVRLGSPRFDQSRDWDTDRRHGSISPRDTAQLFGCCVDVEDLPFAIVHGSSRHVKSEMDIAETCRILGYEPQDGTAFPQA